MSPSTILIADDDRSIRTVLSQALGRAGHDSADNGNSGQSLALDKRTGMVIWSSPMS